MSDGAVTAASVGPSLAQTAFAWFLRLVSAYCLLFGVLYWIRLIGFYDGPLWRVDTMPVYWQVAAVTLAVFYPFAAIGLWMLASWGPVIWAICAAAEIVMYAGFPELFGNRFAVVISHVCVAVLYVGFRGVIFFQRRRVQRHG